MESCFATAVAVMAQAPRISVLGVIGCFSELFPEIANSPQYSYNDAQNSRQ
jgi:hypothetical protein